MTIIIGEFFEGIAIKILKEIKNKKMMKMEKN